MQLTIIQQKILTVRGERVILDFDIAVLFGVETKQLKRAVRRNVDRFPDDFMFELTIEE
ncbi:MAG: ORF6N domain-containing protein [Agriterribacter sp.]